MVGGAGLIRSNTPVDIEMRNVSTRGVTKPFDLAHGSNVTTTDVRIHDDPRYAPGSRSAYSRPLTGPALPIFCPSCKRISPSVNFTFSGGYFRNWGATEQCPRCWSEGAILAEGLFDLTGAALRIVSAPDFTHAMHAALSGILEGVRAGDLSAEQAVEAAEKLSPALASVMKAFRASFNTATFIIAVIGTYYAQASYQLSKEQTEIARESLSIDKAATEPTFEDKVRVQSILRSVLLENALLQKKLEEIEASQARAPEQKTDPKPSDRAN